MSHTCNSSSPFVKVSKKCQKSVTKDLEIFPGGNGSVRLAVTINIYSKMSEFYIDWSEHNSEIIFLCLSTYSLSA